MQTANELFRGGALKLDIPDKLIPALKRRAANQVKNWDDSDDGKVCTIRLSKEATDVCRAILEAIEKAKKKKRKANS